MKTINLSPKVIMITGAAGYIGAMLCDQFSKSPDLTNILAIDIKPIPEILKNNKKIIWITADLRQKVWRIPALINKPEVVIHCAWQDIQTYGDQNEERSPNVDGTKSLSEFAFGSPFVKKIIYFSSTDCYNLSSEDGPNKLLTETSPFSTDDRSYIQEKIEVENIIKSLYENSDKSKRVYVVRLVEVIGPRGEVAHKKSGLLYLLKKVFPVLPIGSSDWSIQCVHEDDLTDIIGILTFTEASRGDGYEVFNVSSSGSIKGEDLAKILNKSFLFIPPVLMRFIFSILWNISRGEIQTPRGFWRRFCYSSLVDNSKISRLYGFEYTYTSEETLRANSGRYDNSLKSDNLNSNVG